MLTLNDGRSELWQWDTGRTLTVDADCSQVHFSNKVFGRSIDVDVADGVATIPDVLLQGEKDIYAWAFVGAPENGYTKISRVFKVNKRNKPADYVFTPSEQTTLAEIMERLDGLESIQDPDAIKNAVDDYLANNPIKVDETDPTVPEWAKQATPPDVKIPDKLPNPNVLTFTGAVSGTYDGSSAVTIDIPVSGGNVDLTGYATEQWVKDQKYLTEVPDGYAKTTEIPKNPEDIGAQPSGNYALKSEIPSVPVQSVNGKTGAVNLSASDVGARPDNWMPSAQEVGALPNTYTPPNQTAEQVGADPKGTATSAVSQHNASDDSHGDIRLELKAINDRLTAFFDSDNQTLDELSEIVAYITRNKSLIDSITTSKVSVADIINNLTSNVTNKPLSAAQGVVLKGLIDTLSNNLANYQPKGDYALRSELPNVPTKLSEFTNDSGFITGYTETDPTVPSWAKQSTKPSYSKSEVGLGNVDNVKQYSASNPPPYPVTSVNGKTGAVSLTIPTVPTKVSAFDNDAGYLTKHQDISGKLDASALPTAINTALAQAKASGEFDGEPGQPGAPGKTPVVGVDYYTDADKAEFETYIATELAKRGQLKPEYAESIEECTDTTKMYVLPDGMIYVYMLTEKEVETGGGDYTNILPLAVKADGTPYVGENGEKGYKTGWRINSSKAEAVQEGMCCTGFMPIPTPTEWYGTLRFKNITVVGTKGGYIYAYGSDRTSGQGSSSTFATALNNSYDENTGVYTLVIGNAKNAPADVTLDDSGFAMINAASYLRVSIGNINENTIITWNEEITEKSTEIVKEYAWVSTGLAFVPADYEPRIIELEEQTAKNTADIRALKKDSVDTGGVDALTWIRNWDSPIYDRVPVFQLPAENPAVPSAERTVPSIYAKYDALVAEHPNYITKKDLGVCSDGVTHVYRYDFCEPEPHYQSGQQWSETKPVIICASGIHWEWGGVYSLYYALKEITENPELDNLRRNVHFVVVPIINPYCFTDIGPYSQTYGILNANGVQIHRNFEVGFIYPGQSGYSELGQRNHGGTEPLSEIETKNIDNIFKEFPDAALFMTCHSAQRDTTWGTGFIWASTATNYTCNLGYRLVDKMSKAWNKKYGTIWEEGCVRENNFVLSDTATYPNATPLAEGDYRAGHAHVSATDGTETRQATKYGIQGANVEVLDTFWVLSNTSLDSKVTTHGAETYINYLLMYMGCYDHKDKRLYAPGV